MRLSVFPDVNGQQIFVLAVNQCYVESMIFIFHYITMREYNLINRIFATVIVCFNAIPEIG